MSTISTAMALLLTSEHASHGQGYVAAPVFGNPDAAKERQLFIIAAGAADDLARCQPLFDSLGQKTFVVADEPWHANLVKLLGNMMSATALEVISEAVAVFRKHGLDPKPFIDIMAGYGEKIVEQSYAPGFVLPLVLKDVRLALAEAEAAGAPMPSVNVVRDRLITGIARGYDNLDWTALGLIAAEEAGIGSVRQQPANPSPAHQKRATRTRI
jgi:3-hydroxyisobutyrate dehydrogenase-like beta-hydroxyacid dehydrogenase